MLRVFGVSAEKKTKTHGTIIIGFRLECKIILKRAVPDAKRLLSYTSTHKLHKHLKHGLENSEKW